MAKTQVLTSAQPKFWEGFTQASMGRKYASAHRGRQAQIIEVLENHKGWNGTRWAHELQEAMSQGDFPMLYADILDREILQRYREAPRVMRQLVRTKSLLGTRTVKRWLDDSATGILEEVGEHGEYQAREKSKIEFTYKPKKYGRRYPLSFEAIVNDDLDFFANIPELMTDAAMNTEEYHLTSLFWNSAGAKDAYFKKGTAGGSNQTPYGQNAVSALPLTEANLATAIQQMMGSKTSSSNYAGKDGEPLNNVPKFLIVPPALQITASRIVKSATLIAIGHGASAAIQGDLNIISDFNINVIVNPWMATIITSGTKGATSWALFSTEVPAGELGLIRGHETPELFIKSSNAQAIGGGMTDPLNGSFEADEIDYKVRYMFGTTTLDPRAGWASDGQ